MLSIFRNGDRSKIDHELQVGIHPEKIIAAETADVHGSAKLVSVFLRIELPHFFERDFRLLFQRHGGSKNF